MSEVRLKAERAKAAAAVLANRPTPDKNRVLLRMAELLWRDRAAIVEANGVDLERGRAGGLSAALLDRLLLNDRRIEAMAEGLRAVAELPDPVGETVERLERPNGLIIEKVRVPLGVVGIVYESRPNVTADAAGLCLKTGNAVVLRGGSAALESNKAIVRALHRALEETDFPPDALQLVEDTDRASVDEMLRLNGLLDVVIPRGGRALIRHVVERASVPVIETGEGVCHTYIDAEADPGKAASIALNAKVQRPSVCNAMETLLVDAPFAEKHLAGLAEQFRTAGVELRGCPRARSLVPWMREATEEDWGTEYLDLILSVRVVDGLDEAIDHIRRYGTRHSECIVTENRERAERFLREIDAAVVYHNASTRFTDGFEFGFGAEIGISTQKLHARGPMGLKELTSYKYVVRGDGQIRT